MFLKSTELGVAMNNDELRRLAQAATPGPWVIDVGATIYSDDGDQTLFDPVCADPEECEQCQADAAYIAAMHPGTALALLDALSAAGQERDRWKALADRRGRQLDKMCGQGRTDSAADTDCPRRQDDCDPACAEWAAGERRCTDSAEGHGITTTEEASDE